ncbi:MAG: YjjG family noncanonical pyrimidine nucleotidase [Gillisia sp.]
MAFSNITHIFFDLDHTLWDFDKNSALTFEAIFKEEKIEVELEEFLETYVPININYWQRYRENKISKEALRLGRLKDSFETLKFSIPDAAILVLAEKYIQFLPTFNHLLEDTIEVLEYLIKDYKLHIITNGFQEIQHTKMANSMIDHYFETVTTSEEVGVKKPHSLIFEKALEKAGASPAKSLMVGDNLEADIFGAERAGMKTIFFDYYAKNQEMKSLRIKKLKELRLYL